MLKLDPPTPDCSLAATRPAHATAWLLVATFAFLALFPIVLLRGMSLDGVIYATIARNMALGIGDFWHPTYTLSTFHEHPPLAFWLESLFFRALGDQWWVERLYSGLTAVPAAVFIVLIWRRLIPATNALRAYAWLPLAFWTLMPAWSWIYRHNYLENTLSVFTLAAIYCVLLAFSGRYWLGWTLLSALAIAAALLSKGPIGLFPLATPVCIWLALGLRGPWKSLGIGVVLTVFLVGVFALLLVNDECREFLASYFQQQVVQSLSGQRETVRSATKNFHVFVGLLRDLWPTALVAAGFVFAIRKRAAGVMQGELRGAFVFCVLTAASASLPIIISPKQSGYYTAPSWPFFSMALALWCGPAIEHLVTRASASLHFAGWNRGLRCAAVAAAVACVALSPLWFGKVFRDHKLIADVERIGRIVEPRQSIAIPESLRTHWGLHAYLFRWHFIALEQNCPAAEYRLDHADPWRAGPAGLALESERLARFEISKREDVASLPATDSRMR